MKDLLFRNRTIPNSDPALLRCEMFEQYSGVNDKNGTKMFEGDIVRGLFYHEHEVLGVVDFKDGAFGLRWKRGMVDEFSPFVCMCNIEYEIVGNIHDNPELLEGTT